MTTAPENGASAAAEAVEGRRRFRTPIAVRWSDCDPAGILYYPNYYSYVEAATLEFFRGKELSWRKLTEIYGVHFPRLESHATYSAPATYEDVVDVELYVPEMTRKVVTLGFTIFEHESQRQLCQGYIKFAMAPLVVPEGERSRAQELPDDVRRLFEELQ